MTKPNLIVAALTAAQRREIHINNLANEIKQPLERLLPVLGLRSPLLRGGQWRCADVTVCPVCSAAAPVDQPHLTPWVFGSRQINCEGGCTLGVAELIDLYCTSNKEIDAALDRLSVGRPKLKRYYCLELLLSAAQNDQPAKWRRALGDDPIATLAKLEPDKDSTVRGVAIDAPDLLAAQSAARSDRELPWGDVPIDQRGRLMRVDWHGAPLSQVERELQRRVAG